MHPLRLQRRVSSAVPVAPASLAGYSLQFRKRGRDRTGKCTIWPAPGAKVLGVIYRLNVHELPALDRAEGTGYQRAWMTVDHLDGRGEIAVVTYAARRHYCGEELLPYDWYQQYVVEGARAHGLPEHYVAALAGLPSRPDPNRRRRREHAAPLAGTALTLSWKNGLTGREGLLQSRSKYRIVTGVKKFNSMRD